MFTWSYFYFYFIWRKNFKSSTFTVPRPFPWQPAYFPILLFLISFLLLQGLWSEPSQFLGQHWKYPSGQSTAWLTEGSTKINCSGLKERKLYASVMEMATERYLTHCRAARGFAGQFQHLTYHRNSAMVEHVFFLGSSLKVLLCNGLTASLQRTLGPSTHWNTSQPPSPVSVSCFWVLFALVSVFWSPRAFPRLLSSACGVDSR